MSKKYVELWVGKESFAKEFRKEGCEVWTLDNNPQFNSSLTGDILDKEIQKIIWKKIKESGGVWMSPVCTTLSMASGNTHWTADRKPKTEEAVKGKKFLDFAWEIAEYCIKNNKLFFIENPRARARWFLPKEYRKTVWYCQYGDSRAKPTDIWTNLDWTPKTCKNGNKDCHHEPAPRGSKTGTQGLKGAEDRSVIPPKLFKEIFNKLKEQTKLISP